MKLSKDKRILFLEPAIKAKMFTFVLPTEKRLVVSFWIFFKYLSNQGELERTEITNKILLMQGYLSQVNLDFS